MSRISPCLQKERWKYSVCSGALLRDEGAFKNDHEIQYVLAGSVAGGSHTIQGAKSLGWKSIQQREVALNRLESTGADRRRSSQVICRLPGRIRRGHVEEASYGHLVD